MILTPYDAPFYTVFLGRISFFANMGGVGVVEIGFMTERKIADWNVSSTEAESGNAPGALLQTPAPLLF